MEKIKILFIISDLQKENTKYKKTIDFFFKHFNDDVIELNYIVDPKREQLETLLNLDNYFCIIPCGLWSVKESHNDKAIIYKYNIIQTLQSQNIGFMGSDYIKSLIFNDRPAYLKMSGIAPEGKIISRYNYKKMHVDKKIKTLFPANLTPLYSGNYISKVKYVANSYDDLIGIVSSIYLSDKDIDEIYIEKQIKERIDISVIIIGNPPYLFDFTSILLHNGDVNINIDIPRDAKTSIIRTAYEFYYKFSFKDFAEFQFTYCKQSKQVYLTDINIHNILKKVIIESLLQLYNMSFQQIIYLFLTVYINNKTEKGTIPLLRYLINRLPNEIVDDLISFENKKLLYNKYNYKDICLELKKRILKPDESNRNELVRLISNTFKNLPVVQTSTSLYLGEEDYSFLDDFKEIPLYPQDPQLTLEKSSQILNGQMRWHVPSMLYNIDPSIMFSPIVASTFTNLYNPSAMSSIYCAGYIEMEKQIVSQLSSLIGWNAQKSSGVFTPGGKICLSYGIKAGINRCKRQYNSTTAPVVVCSEINHFSIEAVCYQLGLPKKNCIRVPLTPSGTIDFHKYEQILIDLFEKKIPIACIVFSGGNTTHCVVEDIFHGTQILKNILRKWNIKYIPFVYYDLVVCWPWLFFKDYDYETNKLDIKQIVLDKIKFVTKTIEHCYLADGIGIDFHKCGFAPLTNSLFLTKNDEELFFMTDVSVNKAKREPYHYTFCNSRGATDIISAWNILQSVGVEGFQGYIANMLTVANNFASLMPKFDFEVIDTLNTYGFSTILWASIPQKHQNIIECIENGNESIRLNDQYLFYLTEYLKKDAQQGIYVRYLPNYIEVSSRCRIAVIVLLPMTLNLNECNSYKIVEYIGKKKKEYDLEYQKNPNLSFDIMPDEVPK